jgi:hypothetical protein
LQSGGSGSSNITMTRPRDTTRSSKRRRSPSNCPAEVDPKKGSGEEEGTRNDEPCHSIRSAPQEYAPARCDRLTSQAQVRAELRTIQSRWRASESCNRSNGAKVHLARAAEHLVADADDGMAYQPAAA